MIKTALFARRVVLALPFEFRLGLLHLLFLGVAVDAGRRIVDERDAQTCFLVTK